MNKQTDQLKAIFEDEENRYRDDGFSERIVSRLNRRWWIRTCVLGGASAVGLALFVFHFVKIEPLIQRKIATDSLAVGESVIDLLYSNVSLILQIVVVGYVLTTTITMLLQSMNRTDHAG